MATAATTITITTGYRELHIIADALVGLARSIDDDGSDPCSIYEGVFHADDPLRDPALYRRMLEDARDAVHAAIGASDPGTPVAITIG